MKLVIAEKPSVSMSIAKVLGAKQRKDGYTEGNGYVVSWCIGHLVSLSPPESYGEEYKKWDNLPIIPTNWKYEVYKGTKKQFDILKKLMNEKRIDSIVCATDAGREGELIFRLVYNQANCKKPIERLWVSSLEDSAIKKGFQNLKSGKEYNNLYISALCRERADWLIGMNATRYFTIKNGNNGVLSIGRVQTPTLAMIVQRDRDIENFVKSKYYTIEIDCGEFNAVSSKFESRSDVEMIAEKCKTARVNGVITEKKTVNPPKLLDLTSLQREANKIYGFTAQETLDLLQKLYEAKLVTYPRTDSRYLTEDMTDTAKSVISAIVDTMDFTEVYEPDIKKFSDNSKVSDHHAIIPTINIKSKDLSSLSKNEKDLLYLVSAGLLMAVSPKYEYESTSILLKCVDCDFKAVGKQVTNKGFKEISEQFAAHTRSQKENEDDNILPYVVSGDEFSVTAKVLEHFTQPPKPYTEDTLLSAMESAGSSDYIETDIERKGLGTPATRAGIIETLLKRDYIKRNNKQLISTEKGRSLIDTVPEALKSAKMTADWENELSLIAKGKSDSTAFMAEITELVKSIVK